ncbi:polymorphic toxin type 37 domain-containing protein [Rheinheimera baltica]|uniref:polymorphic toxin type 37 domain-containing protein n=1 Tax=Rheinheimera baltica TaxID=67576 RepID=UPI000487F806|nr:polymorphic toxin type 37 domain-containing protein [Rheinheimera baltica]
MGAVGGGLFDKLGTLKKASGKGLGNPFKNKTAKEIDKMFMDKGFRKSGPDPLNGYGGYVNPKTGRSYHIDPKENGKYREPNHVDVNRLRDYKGGLDKKKLPYKG